MEGAKILSNSMFDEISLEEPIMNEQDFEDIDDNKTSTQIRSDNANTVQDFEAIGNGTPTQDRCDNANSNNSGDNLQHLEHFSDKTAQISFDIANRNNSANNLPETSDIENEASMQDRGNNTNSRNSEESLKDFEDIHNEASLADKCDAAQVNIKESQDNLLDNVALRKTKIYSDCESTFDVLTNDAQDVNASVNEESMCESATMCDMSEGEVSPLSPASSVSNAPLSPESINSESAVDFGENESFGSERDRTSRKSSLPYFQLPNPDFDEYLIATDAFLSGNKESKSSRKEPITFTRKSVLEEFLEKFPSEKSPYQQQNTHSKYNEEVIRISCASEYSKAISCIGKLDESNSPGIKRLALKEFLKKQIEEKKSAAFNRSKEISNLENEEIESDHEGEEQYSGIESSDEDCEEQTVSLSPKDREENDESEKNFFEDEDNDENEKINLEDEDNDENEKINLEDEDNDESAKNNINDEDDDKNEGDIINDNDYDEIKGNNVNEDGDESDEDIVTVKPKRPQILEDDSSDSDGVTDCINETEQKSTEYDEKRDFGFKSGFFSNGPTSDMSFSDIPSYQPNPDLFAKQDSCDSVASEICNSEKNKSLNSSVAPFPMSVDDPPIPLSETFGSPMFLSQDLAALCSGSFKDKDDVNKQTIMSQWEEDQCLSEKEENEKKFADLTENLPVEEKMNDFFDLEAELSGEDEGEDDLESDGNESVCDMIASDHELPSNAEIREEIADLHIKHLIHDDDDLLKEVKERFLDDGELHGDGRTRRFAWKNNAVDIVDAKDRMSSDSEDEAPADSWNQEKAKWREENKEDDDLPDEVVSNNKTLLKVKILGKMEFSQNIEHSSKRLSFKRPRGSLLHLDNSSASQVLKKLKTSEENHNGSRTTKHFVFRNDVGEDFACGTKKEVSSSLTPQNPIITSTISNKSIFTKM